MPRLFATMAVLVTLLGPVSGAHAFTPPADSLTESLIELRLPGAIARTVPALQGPSTLLLSLSAFLDLVELGGGTTIHEVAWVGVVEPEGVRIRIGTAPLIVERGDNMAMLADELAAWRPDGLYLAPRVLARAFGVLFSVNWSDLVVTITGSHRLPVGQRLRREQRRVISLQARPSHPRTQITWNPRALRGGVLDWAVLTDLQNPGQATGINLGAGAEVLGGILNLYHSERRTAAGRLSFSRGDWTRVWMGNRWVQQLRIGSMPGVGFAPRDMFGVLVTNSPHVRPAVFQEEELRMQLPQGWDAEIYRDHRLTAVVDPSDAGGPALRLPLRYGPNQFDIMAFGPNGEVRTVRRSIVVPSEWLPAKRFEYAVGGGRCFDDPCQVTAFASARYGVLSRLTLTAGAEFIWRDTLPNIRYPVFGISGAPARGLNLGVDAALNGFLHGRLSFIPSPDFELRLEHAEFGTNPRTSWRRTGTTRRTAGSWLWRPGRHDRAPFVRVAGSRSESPSGTHILARASGTMWYRRLRLEGGFTQTHGVTVVGPQIGQTTLDVGVGSTLGSLAPWLRRTFARAQLFVGLDRSSTMVVVGLSHYLTSNLRFETGSHVDFASGRYGLTLSISATFGGVRAIGRSRYTDAYGLSATQSFEGSLIYDPEDGRIRFDNGRGVGRAGLAGSVFFDEDGDGVRGADEAGAPDIALRVGPYRAVTDSLGRFTTWGVVALTSVPVNIDTLSLANPTWVPRDPGLAVVPGPNAITHLDIALVHAAEVSGTIYVAATGRSLASVPLVLRHAGRGIEYRLHTFRDGTFYHYGLPPGEYELRVPGATLQQLGLEGDPLVFRIEPSRDGMSIDDLLLELRPTQTDESQEGRNRE